MAWSKSSMAPCSSNPVSQPTSNELGYHITLPPSLPTYERRNLRKNPLGARNQRNNTAEEETQCWQRTSLVRFCSRHPATEGASTLCRYLLAQATWRELTQSDDQPLLLELNTNSSPDYPNLYQDLEFGQTKILCIPLGHLMRRSSARYPQWESEAGMEDPRWNQP